MNNNIGNQIHQTKQYNHTAYASVSGFVKLKKIFIKKTLSTQCSKSKN